MRRIVNCVILAAALAGCQADTDPVGPGTSAPSTPSAATCLRRAGTPGSPSPRSTSRSSTFVDGRCR
jgi:hypothetical protein